MHGKQDSTKYYVLLKDDLLPFAAWHMVKTGHISKIKQLSIVLLGFALVSMLLRHPHGHCFYTKKWFRGSNVTVVPWPSRSPDLNPIENLCGILARRSHGKRRQFNDTVELFDAIVDYWLGINDSIL